MYKHIFWDFDGTLFNTYPAMVGALQKALAECGHTVDDQEILAQMKVTFSHAMRHFAALYSLDADHLTQRANQWRKVDEPNLCVPYEGIPALCSAITQSGRGNYLYTHRDATAVDMLRKFDMLKDFAGIVTADQGFARKPSPEALIYLMDQHNLDPKQSVMIGDRDLDVICGKNAGMDGCFFALDGGQSDGSADHQVVTMQQLYQVIGLEK